MAALGNERIDFGAGGRRQETGDRIQNTEQLVVVLDSGRAEKPDPYPIYN
jgi:hypothetical protein